MVRGRHFEHEEVNNTIMREVFERKILPWCKENGLELLIMDNDPKLHSKSVVFHGRKRRADISGVREKPMGTPIS